MASRELHQRDGCLDKRSYQFGVEWFAPVFGRYPRKFWRAKVGIEIPPATLLLRECSRINVGNPIPVLKMIFLGLPHEVEREGVRTTEGKSFRSMISALAHQNFP